MSTDADHTCTRCNGYSQYPNSYCLDCSLLVGSTYKAQLINAVVSLCHLYTMRHYAQDNTVRIHWRQVVDLLSKDLKCSKPQANVWWEHARTKDHSLLEKVTT